MGDITSADTDLQQSLLIRYIRETIRHTGCKKLTLPLGKYGLWRLSAKVHIITSLYRKSIPVTLPIISDPECRCKCGAALSVTRAV